MRESRLDLWRAEVAPHGSGLHVAGSTRRCRWRTKACGVGCLIRPARGHRERGGRWQKHAVLCHVAVSSPKDTAGKKNKTIVQLPLKHSKTEIWTRKLKRIFSGDEFGRKFPNTSKRNAARACSDERPVSFANHNFSKSITSYSWCEACGFMLTFGMLHTSFTSLALIAANFVCTHVNTDLSINPKCRGTFHFGSAQRFLTSHEQKDARQKESPEC